MILTDYIALSGLAASLWFWWRRGVAGRNVWLVAASLVTLVMGAWSIVDDRWQAGLVLVPAGLMLLGLLIGRKWPRSGTPWISGILFMLLAGVAFLAIWYFPVTHLPAPSGGYPVGVRDFELQDTSRPGLIAAGPEEPRRLLVRVWYPAAGTQGYDRRAYFKSQEVDTTAESMGRLLNAGFLFKYLKHVKTNSYENAPLVNGLENLPVVVYSHGYTSFAGQNTALMEELASHGYTVYSIQHTYDSGPTVFPNGDVLDSDPQLLRDMQAQATPSEATRKAFVGQTFADRYEGHLQAHREAMAANERIAARSTKIWTEDRIFVLDQLQAGSVPDSVRDIVVAGDFKHTGQIGMSFGGSTTGEVCIVDPRCAAGVNLDGGDFHFTSFGQNEPVPFLMFYSDFNQLAKYFGGDPNALAHGFNDFSYERPETAGLRPDVVRLKVNSVTHLGVSDFTLFMRRPVRNAVFGSIDSDDMIQIQNDFVVGFFDRYVRQQDNGFPREQFETHQAWVERLNLDALRDDWLQTHPEDRTVRVELQTQSGEIVVALYPERAPLATARFLAAVDGGLYANGQLYRTQLGESGWPLDLVLGAPAEHGIAGVEDTASEIPGSNRPSGQQEPLTQQGSLESSAIPNEPGVLAILTSTHTSGPEFFINVDAPRRVSANEPAEDPGSRSYVTVGRVLTGLPLLRRLQSGLPGSPLSGEAGTSQPDQKVVEILAIKRLD